MQITTTNTNALVLQRHLGDRRLRPWTRHDITITHAVTVIACANTAVTASGTLSLPTGHRRGTAPAPESAGGGTGGQGVGAAEARAGKNSRD